MRLAGTGARQGYGIYDISMMVNCGSTIFIAMRADLMLQVCTSFFIFFTPSVLLYLHSLLASLYMMRTVYHTDALE